MTEEASVAVSTSGVPALVVDPPDAPPPPQMEPDRDDAPRGAADKEEFGIEPDSLRVDAQRVGEELFGAHYTGISSYGPTAYGSHNTINNYARPPLKPIVGQLIDVVELLKCYSESDADVALDRVMRQRSALCLTGPKNSGRFSAACAALARRHAADRVHEIFLPPGVLPEALLEHPDLVLDGRGYVLQLPGNGHIETMRLLAALFHRRSATILLIRDEGARGREPHQAEVRHRQPDPIDVFRKHLQQQLRVGHELSYIRSAETTELYLQTAGLQQELGNTAGPQEVVQLARKIGEQHPVGDEAMQSILSASQPRLRRRASRILLPPEDGAPSRRRRAGQHERAFRIAYAVFRQQPMHYVFESAAWLLAEIDSAALRPEWGRMALECPVQDLLGEELRGDWFEGRNPGKSSSGPTRSAWIRDRGLRGAILDVAWHDFDGTRESLLRWLDRLVHEGDTTMVRAAAETAALLAHHDFERMHDKLIDRWAASPRPRIRQAAAWTETVAAMGGHVGHLVREKLGAWCYGTSNYQRDTAARVYASGLRQRQLEWSMSDLRRIAADRLQRQEHAIAEGVNQLYEPDQAGWLVTELAHWTGSSGIRLHAGRAMLVLAAKPAGDAAGERPELLVRLAAGDIDSASMAKVWRVALVEPDLSASAWPILADWLGHADSDEQLRPTVAELLEALASGAHAGRRMLFFFTRTSRFEDGVPLWVRQMLENR
ncbi:hypothetical protein AB0I61_13055 [Polymorphospora rubra]|uniref:hypothetical protein n=1 Tax=Polymorphospora rubra TaxID=338584 RepID=UPI0033EB6BAC